MRKFDSLRWLSSVLLFVSSVVAIFPMAWLFITVLKTDELIHVIPPLLPGQFSPSLVHLIEIWQYPLYFQNYLVNSVLIAGTTTVVGLILGILAGFGFARFEFGRKENWGSFIFSFKMLPPIALAVPLYILYDSVGLIDTHVGIILAYLTFTLPFTTWLMRTYFEEVPRDLIDSALIDGCNLYQTLRRIVLPVSTSGVAVTAMLAFIFCWNELLLVASLGRGTVMTVPIALSGMRTHGGYLWGQLFACQIFSFIPLFIVFLFIQRHIVRGLTLGAVKG